MFFRLIKYIWISLLLLNLGIADAYSQVDVSPLDYLQEQEKKNKDAKGEILLGKVMTITYTAYTYNVDEEYYPFILELTDILKSPLRKNYRLVLKGYSDNSGDARDNLELSAKRAENLKNLLIKKYYMDGERISTEGYGESDPVAPNDTAEERMLNRRVEIFVYGDVSEAVRFID